MFPVECSDIYNKISEITQSLMHENRWSGNKTEFTTWWNGKVLFLKRKIIGPTGAPWHWQSQGLKLVWQHPLIYIWPLNLIGQSPKVVCNQPRSWCRLLEPTDYFILVYLSLCRSQCKAPPPPPWEHHGPVPGCGNFELWVSKTHLYGPRHKMPNPLAWGHTSVTNTLVTPLHKQGYVATMKLPFWVSKINKCPCPVAHHHPCGA